MKDDQPRFDPQLRRIDQPTMSYQEFEPQDPTFDDKADSTSRTSQLSGTPQSVSQSLLHLQDVRLTLESRAGPVEILKGINFAVAQGQSVAIVGPSGSGKTSLLMIIAGLERATSGTVTISGHDFSKLGEDDLARIRGEEIGIIFQSFHLVPTMTARENVALPLDLAGVSAADETAGNYLDSVGLGARHDHYPPQLSGGEQQRVALARALSPEPSLILADEPTGNLDGKTGESVIELLFGLKKDRSATLVLVTHDEALAARCERTIRMADGYIVADETAHSK